MQWSQIELFFRFLDRSSMTPEGIFNLLQMPKYNAFKFQWRLGDQKINPKFRLMFQTSSRYFIGRGTAQAATKKVKCTDLHVNSDLKYALRYLVRSGGSFFFVFVLQLHSSSRRATRDPCNHNTLLQLEPTEG